MILIILLIILTLYFLAGTIRGWKANHFDKTVTGLLAFIATLFLLLYDLFVVHR